MGRVYQFGNPLSERQDSPRLIADALRGAIIQGRLLPGEPLRQEQLAAHFKVSRIPLREALRGLESEGWIEFLPNRGARVSGLSAAEVMEIYEIRASLECTALRLAFARHTRSSWREVASALRAARREGQRSRYVQRNREFHLSLYRPAARPHLLALIESLHRRGERYLRLKLEMPVHKRASDEEHRQIYRACRHGDLDRASQVLAAHLLLTGSVLARQLGSQAEPPDRAAALT
ncbi:MAG TPA: GntR family transcriptional regulator [Steroidobacteraceae bacterium]|nr:GntR family transcriptional regulator [Steroidobacteraceae bacterium]